MSGPRANSKGRSHARHEWQRTQSSEREARGPAQTGEALAQGGACRRSRSDSAAEVVAAAGSAAPGLREVQQALAREHGFESWAALKAHVELEQLSARPADGLADELLEKACLSYGNDDFPSKWQRAARIVVRFPEVATANLCTAVVTGELEHVCRLLDRQPKLAHTKAGPQG
jgi:hypothetical protein